MNPDNTNKQSKSAGNAGDASLVRSTPPSAPRVHDKENRPNQSNDNDPMFQNLSKSNQHSLHGEMNAYNLNSPLLARSKLASGSKGSSPVKARYSDGGAISGLRADPPINPHQGKSPRKRSASMADMDDSPSPLKRSRSDVPFVFMKDLTLFDENPVMARLIFLDILEAQQRRELCPEEELKIPFLVPSVDCRDLSGNKGASRMDAPVKAGSDEATRTSAESEVGDSQSLSVPREDSIYWNLHRDLLIWEDMQYPKKAQDRSPQTRGGPATPHIGDSLHEENRVDAVEASTDCETNGPLPSQAPLPRVEEATITGLSEVESNDDPIPILDDSTFEPISPLMVLAPPEAVPEASLLPKANETNTTGERETSGVQRTEHAVSNGIVGTGVAGPSHTASSAPFAYSQAQADKIWERARDKDYLGAHALFDPREQVKIIYGEEKVRRYLNAHHEMKVSLRTTADGNPRQSLYICGASAIWRRVEDQTSGATPEYSLTYEPCRDSAYASMDNYKKHVYRHHLCKVYKEYRKGRGRA